MITNDFHFIRHKDGRSVLVKLSDDGSRYCAEYDLNSKDESKCEPTVPVEEFTRHRGECQDGTPLVAWIAVTLIRELLAPAGRPIPGSREEQMLGVIRAARDYVHEVGCTERECREECVKATEALGE